MTNRLFELWSIAQLDIIQFWGYFRIADTTATQPKGPLAVFSNEECEFINPG
jgi:hypothetical protein